MNRPIENSSTVLTIKGCYLEERIESLGAFLQEEDYRLKMRIVLIFRALQFFVVWCDTFSFQKKKKKHELFSSLWSTFVLNGNDRNGGFLCQTKIHIAHNPHDMLRTVVD